MLLPKETLEQIEYYSITQKNNFQAFTSINDVIILHFKQWWKSDQTILLIRDSYDLDPLTGIFSHKTSDSAVELINQLDGYIASTFSESPNNFLIKKNKATVLKIVPDPEDQK